MVYKSLVFQKTDAVGIITLNRPDAHNAVDVTLADELAEVCDAIAIDDDIKVVIVTGSGQQAFCAGTDPAIVPEITGRKLEGRLPSVATPVAALHIPVIATINGDALGQGLELALACDIRIAAETARFAITHIDAGLVPWDGATQRLPRIIGRARAMEMIITGKYITAGEAFQIGLVSRIVPTPELLPSALHMAREMAAKAPTALEYAKEAILTGSDLTLEQGLRLESDLYFLLQTTEDRTEGITAFLKKKPPKFKGK